MEENVVEKAKMPKKTITIRGLPEGTREALGRLAVEHGRALEAEARHAIKQYVDPPKGVTAPTAQDGRRYDVEYEEWKVRQVCAKRDSIKRKLDGGSEAVTGEDLEPVEGELADARLKLAEVST